MGLREMDSALPPGFRFYPSDEELVCFYLRNKVANQRVASWTLVEVDLHAREPWELPDVAKLTAEEWYFFSFRDRKYATGSRTNRATKTGYWKATGKDRVVHEPGTRELVGMRKTLVFYRGRAPNGQKTGWVMHEFRLETPNSPPKEDWVLCRVFNKMKLSSEGEETGGSRRISGALLMTNLQAMLQQGSSCFLDYCSPVVHHGLAVAVPHNAGCGDDAAVAMELGHVVGFEEHGLGEIEMEYAQAQGGCGLYL